MEDLEKMDKMIVIIVGFLIAIFFFALGATCTHDYHVKTNIEKGFMRYNSKTGVAEYVEIQEFYKNKDK